MNTLKKFEIILRAKNSVVPEDYSSAELTKVQGELQEGAFCISGALGINRPILNGMEDGSN